MGASGAPGAPGGPPYSMPADEEPLAVVKTPDLASAISELLKFEDPILPPCVVVDTPGAPSGSPLGAPSPRDPPYGGGPSCEGAPPPSCGGPSDGPSSWRPGGPPTVPSDYSSTGASDYIGVSAVSLPSFTSGESESEIPTQILNQNPKP